MKRHDKSWPIIRDRVRVHKERASTSQTGVSSAAGSSSLVLSTFFIFIVTRDKTVALLPGKMLTVFGSRMLHPRKVACALFPPRDICVVATACKRFSFIFYFQKCRSAIFVDGHRFFFSIPVIFDRARYTRRPPYYKTCNIAILLVPKTALIK